MHWPEGDSQIVRVFSVRAEPLNYNNQFSRRNKNVDARFNCVGDTYVKKKLNKRLLLMSLEIYFNNLSNVKRNLYVVGSGFLSNNRNASLQNRNGTGAVDWEVDRELW